MHGFRQGVSGLPFLGIVVGALVAAILYVLYIYYYLNPKWVRQGYLTPEERLVLLVVSGPTIPISLFIFGEWFSCFGWIGVVNWD